MDTVKLNTPAPSKTFLTGKLKVNVYTTRIEMGSAAAMAVAEKLRSLLQLGEEFVNMIFAAAPSQNEFLQQLS
jgi:glucosamine-6-phosphate deaminase